MQQLWVSIVVNNFNYERFLRQSIDSALAQDYPHKEVVVVDDASTDGSVDIVRGYASAVVPVLRPINGGQGAAFNAGFAAARGDIVIYLDADDYLYPGAAKRVVEAWQPGLAVAQYRLHIVDEEGSVLDIFPPPEVSFDSGDVKQRLLTTGRYEGTVTSGMALGRAALAAVLPVPESDFRLGADGYLATTTPFHGPVASIDQPLGAYRRHGSNRWATSRSAHLQRAIRHDLLKYELLAAKARSLGLRSSERPGERDYSHLMIRMASLCLDPEHHPIATDTRLRIALRGVRSCGSARLSARHKVILGLWFLAVGVLPRRMASAVVQWPLDPSSKGPRIKRVLRSIRSWLR